MKRFFIAVALFALVLGATPIRSLNAAPPVRSLDAPPAATIAVNARHGRSVRGTIDGIPFLILRGNARERGIDHGFLAGQEFLRVLDEALLPFLESQQPGAWQKMFVAQVGQFTWPARFQDEMAGFMAGLGEARPKKEDRLLKTLQREVSLADLQALNALTDILGTGCSSFSAWGKFTADGRPIVGRNLDYMAFPMSKHFTVVAVEPTEKGLLPTIDFMAPGFLGAGTTLNGEGVFAAMHDEAGLASATKPGWVPRAFALRMAVESARGKSAVADMAAALRRSRVKVGNNIHVVGPAPPSAVLEWDGNPKGAGVTIRKAANGGSIVCTNHYVARAKRPGDGDSGVRHATLTTTLAKGGPIDVQAAKALLSSVGREGGVVTHLSVIAWPASRRIAFAFSPGTGKSATDGRWVSFGWDALFQN